MENVEKSDILALSTKTMAVFRNIEGLTDIVMNRAKTMTAMLADTLKPKR